MAKDGWPLVRHGTDGIAPSGGSIAHAGQRTSAASISFLVLIRNTEPRIGEVAGNSTRCLAN